MTGPIAHGGGIAAAASIHGGTPAEWLDLSTGVNPNPAALPDILESAWSRLPDRDLFDAARLAARTYYGSGDLLPLPVPGTQSVIQLLPRLVPQGRRVAVVSPTYGEYERAFLAAGLAVDTVPGPASITPAHGLAVIVNPNNPDGRGYDRSAIAALARKMEAQGGRLVVDEAFADMTPEASVADLAGEGSGLVVLRSFGKFFGLAGLRLGFVLSNRETMDAFEQWLGPWAVSGPALVIAAGLLSGDTDRIRDCISTRKAALDSILKRAGLTIAGGTGLFSLVEHEAAGALHHHLCAARILVRKFDYNRRWLRFGLAPDADADARLSQALNTFRTRA